MTSALLLKIIEVNESKGWSVSGSSAQEGGDGVRLSRLVVVVVRLCSLSSDSKRGFTNVYLRVWGRRLRCCRIGMEGTLFGGTRLIR